jgi:hypothetical protein
MHRPPPAAWAGTAFAGSEADAHAFLPAIAHAIDVAMQRCTPHRESRRADTMTVRRSRL